MIYVQWTQSHESTTAECSGRPPIMGLQIVPQRNLLFQLVESLTTHGLLASIGRIRQSAPRSQATMVGDCKKRWRCTPALIQHHRLMSRRCTHRPRWMDRASVLGSYSAVWLARQFYQ